MSEEIKDLNESTEVEEKDVEAQPVSEEANTVSNEDSANEVEGLGMFSRPC